MWRPGQTLGLQTFQPELFHRSVTFKLMGRVNDIGFRSQQSLLNYFTVYIFRERMARVLSYFHTFFTDYILSLTVTTDPNAPVPTVSPTNSALPSNPNTGGSLNTASLVATIIGTVIGFFALVIAIFQWFRRGREVN